MRIGRLNSPFISWALCACFSVLSITHLLVATQDYGFIYLGVVFALVALLFGVLARRVTRSRKRHVDAAAGIVTGIVGSVFLSALLLPNLTSERVGARKITCIQNLKQIGLAIRMYAQENKGQYPDKNNAEGLEMLRAGGYLENPQMYTCPTTNRNPDRYAKDGERLTEKSVDYFYIGGYNESTPPDIAIAYDKPTNNHHGYGNILFADGHVQGYDGTKWMSNVKK